MPLLSSWAVLMFAGVLILSLGIAWIGWRGRRVNEHPICARCGFDLVGLPAESHTCSECGADLRKRRSIRAGLRRRRAGPLVAGLLLTALALAGLGGTSWARLRHVDWARYKPVWWLLREARGSDTEARDQAFAELTSRMDANKLTDRQIASITDRALNVQGRFDLPWSNAWGDLVESAHKADRLPRDRWARYVEQAIRASAELMVRPKVRRGDRLPFRLDFTMRRVGSAGLGDLEIELTQDLALDHVRFPLGVDDAVGAISLDDKSRHTVMDHVISLSKDRLAQLQDGEHEGELHARIQVVGWPHGKRDVVADPFFLTLRAQWRLIPADETSVELVTDPNLRDAVHHTLCPTASRDQASRTWQIGVFWENPSAPPRVPLMMDVVVKQGNQEHCVLFVAIKASGSYTASRDVTQFPLDQEVQIFARPNPKAAVETVDVLKIWNEVIPGKILPPDGKPWKSD